MENRLTGYKRLTLSFAGLVLLSFWKAVFAVHTLVSPANDHARLVLVLALGSSLVASVVVVLGRRHGLGLLPVGLVALHLGEALLVWWNTPLALIGLVGLSLLACAGHGALTGQWSERFRELARIYPQFE